ncbi:M20 family metallopeptidase [Aquitalea sp. ASV15]|uniref:M20 family metallopeptidase n=1 Tax=Aquitalea sp. ASV15 TaxID=2795104 RepID=UPI0018EAF11B|nr:M20 family metallopeptidase [Aquitalea sp. ASV15]
MTQMYAQRSHAIARAQAYFDQGGLLGDLQRRVAFHTESQNPVQADTQIAYFQQEIIPALQEMGFSCRLLDNPVAPLAPFLLARRHEADHLPTVLSYGHADVVRGDESHWRAGLSPWRVASEGERWYGRGTADNKGQHSINLAALAAVYAQRGGRLGFNCSFLFESGEEISSPGLREICQIEQAALRADVFIASDGPRVSAERPTLFLGSRGSVVFELQLILRESGHHSGNWGGALRNPALVLAHALASLVDAHGVIQVPGLRPPPLEEEVRRALAGLILAGEPDSPTVDSDWGEPGLSPLERVIGWNALEVLALESGNTRKPVNAIPPSAKAVCQLRFVVGTDWRNTRQHIESHLQRHGLGQVQVRVLSATPATRLRLDDPWVTWALASIRHSTDKQAALLPNLGGTVPNDAFADILGLPTLWLPHSYPGCGQHAPNEHLLAPVAREALALMAGIWWDLGEQGSQIIAQRASFTGAAHV